MRTVFLFLCATLFLGTGCNDDRLVDLTMGEPTQPTPVDVDVPEDFQPRLYFVWDASDTMLQPVSGLDLDTDGVAGSYDPDDNIRWAFSCSDKNDIVHPYYGTTWVSWDEVSNTRYDMMLMGLLRFLDQGSDDPAANGNLDDGTPLDPGTNITTCAPSMGNGKDDNHDSDQIDLAMLALGTSYGFDRQPATADDAVCRFKEETADVVRQGGGPVRSFFRESQGDGGFPADTTQIHGITHNDWVADHAIYTDVGGQAQLGLALQVLAEPADGALNADGIASIPDVIARDANGSCRPYAVIVVSAGGNASGCTPGVDDAAEEAAAQLLTDGVPTYVVAPNDVDSGSRSYLDELALAGGTTPLYVGAPSEANGAFQQIANELMLASTDCP